MKKTKPFAVCLNLRELRQAFNSVDSGTSGDVNFCASAALFNAMRIDQIYSILSQLLKQTMRQNQILLKAKKRNPTLYQMKVGRFLKEGKSIQEAHKLAKELETKGGHMTY